MFDLMSVITAVMLLVACVAGMSAFQVYLYFEAWRPKSSWLGGRFGDKVFFWVMLPVTIATWAFSLGCVFELIGMFL